MTPRRRWCPHGARNRPEQAMRTCETNPIRETHVIADLAELVGEGRRFATVYADPPWRYANSGTRGAAGRHYRTMTIDEIAAMPVARLAADRAHCHLWTTTSFLPAALDVLRAWGFTYKSQLIWAKPTLGMGNYWRVSHEILLLGVRGGLPFADRSCRSWFEAPRGRHSEKPWRVRNRIERVSPRPYLELFGRELVEGWTVFGNQVAEDVLRFGVPA